MPRVGAPQPVWAEGRRDGDGKEYDEAGNVTNQPPRPVNQKGQWVLPAGPGIVPRPDYGKHHKSSPCPPDGVAPRNYALYPLTGCLSLEHSE